MINVFLAGVMQGKRLDDQIDDQTYRTLLTEALTTHVPDVRITDPWALNPGSVHYDENRARTTFLTMTRLASKADALIAYLPTVSMGTAMEMWEAVQTDTYIVAVTPHVHHWAIRFTAHRILPSLDDVLTQIASGEFLEAVQAHVAVDAPLSAD